jgi:hypothetical protein
VGWFRLSLRPHDHRPRRSAAEPSARRALGVACLGLVCTLLVSCGGEPILAPPVAPSPQVTSSSSAVAAATPVITAEESRIGGIIWASATDPTTSAPIEPVSSYRPNAPRIIAAVQSDTLPAGSLVAATWEYNDTSLDAFTTQLTAPDSDAEHWLIFYIERDPEVPWPVGAYEVTISLDGTPMQQDSVEVANQS